MKRLKWFNCGFSFLVLALTWSPAMAASPALSVPFAENIGANMVTLALQSSGTGTGYFTLLSGSGTACGTGTQVAAGQDSTGTMAPFHSSLPLTVNTQGLFTVRNLTQHTDYTICFTADSPTGASLNSTPVAANFTTAASTVIPNPDWGAVGGTAFTAASIQFTSLAFASDGTPYVAYCNTSGTQKTAMMKYSGGAWNLVGSAGFSDGAATLTSLAFSPDGTPYVAYQDSTYGENLTVMKFKNGAWSLVGSKGLTSHYVTDITLAFSPDGTPYVGYTNGITVKPTVVKYSGFSSANPTGWSVVGTDGFSVGYVAYTSLALSPDGIPYVAYKDTANSNKVTVMKYSDGAWNVVGVPSGSVGYAFSFAFSPDGIPYVAYQDWNNNQKLTLIKYVGVSSTWVTGWASVGNPAFTSSAAWYPSLAFSPDGTPYVAFSYGGSYKAEVMKYSDEAWSVVGRGEFSSGEADHLSLAFSPSGTPYVSYTDNHNSYKATVMTLFNTPTITTISPTIGPLSGGTSVTIIGTGFTGATAVNFGSTSAASFIVNSDTQITAISPTGSAGTVDITVSGPEVTSFPSTADQFTFNPLPSAPTNVTATATNGQASVSFSAPASSGSSAITSYTVTVTPGNKTVSGTKSPIIVTGLTNSTIYTFTVKATNGSGAGPAATATNLNGLAVTLNGTGSGSINSTPSGISCTSGTCINNFSSGSAFSLLPTASPGSQFIGWAGPCSASGSLCGVIFNALYQNVTATFNNLPNVQVVGNSQLFGLIQQAYNAAGITNAVIKAQGITFAEAINMATSKSVTLEGGFDAAFASQNGNSMLQGSLTVGQGSLVVSHLTIE
ncbi:MAG: fibronectin type III domain-containing protein [Desulfuromonadales bacterium]|nr:fibronectin type III domain-containing protein [Desulfuromonadales bacterium]